LKRAFDIILSVVGLLALCPLFFWIGWQIKREDGGPVFYRGVRMGLHGKPFRIYKFRTMVVDAEKMGPSSTAEGDPRITRVGRWIRRNKLDELPQLFNVFLGDMSFVGPRPQVQWAVDLYTPEEKAILGVRPGITDYASLRFANEAEILKGSEDPDKVYLEKIHPEKMQLSLEYIINRSFWLDLKLIFLTVANILKM
jgi:lipopolysaccharide/colanic/teichoic acid biosynthesis glycosyltransferase